MENYYWNAESWGDAYPPENAEEIIDEANDMIAAVEAVDGEDAAEAFSERLWDLYCQTGSLEP